MALYSPGSEVSGGSGVLGGGAGAGSGVRGAVVDGRPTSRRQPEYARIMSDANELPSCA